MPLGREDIFNNLLVESLDLYILKSSASVDEPQYVLAASWEEAVLIGQFWFDADQSEGVFAEVRCVTAYRPRKGWRDHENENENDVPA